jgi:hypothetical protein
LLFAAIAHCREGRGYYMPGTFHMRLRQFHVSESIDEFSQSYIVLDRKPRS